MAITPLGVFYFTHTQKQKIKLHSPTLIFWGLFLNGISLNFYRKPRNVHFDLTSVFSLSCKISLADLWSLFMECITFGTLFSKKGYIHFCRPMPRSLRNSYFPSPHPQKNFCSYFGKYFFSKKLLNKKYSKRRCLQ